MYKKPNVCTMRILTLLALSFALSLPLWAQRGAPALFGARGAGMGFAALNFTDINSAFANQSGLAQLSSLAATVTGEQRFGLAEVRNFAAAAALPTGSGAFGLTLQYYGFDDYNEQKAGLAYARKLSDLIAIGGQFVVLNTRIPEYGNQTSLTFELGLQAELLPEVTIGAHVYSPLRVETLEGEYLPSILRVGASYRPSEQVLLAFEVEKDIDFPTRTKGGIEYQLVEPLALRVGFATAPAIFTFGAGYAVGSQLTIDFGAYYHQQLGLTPAISVTYCKP